jgi:hypothetical protein
MIHTAGSHLVQTDGGLLQDHCNQLHWALAAEAIHYFLIADFAVLKRPALGSWNSALRNAARRSTASTNAYSILLRILANLHHLNENELHGNGKDKPRYIYRAAVHL